MALEKKVNSQADYIIELESSVDGKTFLAETMDYSVSALSMGDRKELMEIREIMKQLVSSFTA